MHTQSTAHTPNKHSALISSEELRNKLSWKHHITILVTKMRMSVKTRGNGVTREWAHNSSVVRTAINVHGLFCQIYILALHLQKRKTP